MTERRRLGGKPQVSQYALACFAIQFTASGFMSLRGTRMVRPGFLTNRWMNQRQLQMIEYLREENQVLREQLGERLLRCSRTTANPRVARQVVQAVLAREMFPCETQRIDLQWSWRLAKGNPGSGSPLQDARGWELRPREEVARFERIRSKPISAHREFDRGTGVCRLSYRRESVYGTALAEPS